MSIIEAGDGPCVCLRIEIVLELRCGSFCRVVDFDDMLTVVIGKGIVKDVEADFVGKSLENSKLKALAYHVG